MAEAHQRFEACQLQLKKMEVILACVKAAQTSGLHSAKFADAMRAEMHRMSLQPVVKEDTLFPPCMRVLYLKHELEMVEPDEFWQRLGEFKDICLKRAEVHAQQGGCSSASRRGRVGGSWSVSRQGRGEPPGAWAWHLWRLIYS